MGFALGCSAFVLARDLFNRSWIAFSDSGVFLAIVTQWAQGARLYADVWDSKGPLFFAALRPSAALLARRVAYEAPEILVLWVPIFLMYGASLWLLARYLKLMPWAAFALGAGVSALLWGPILAEFFSSEYLSSALGMLALALALQARPARWKSAVVAVLLTAALLCNWRFATFGVFYFLQPEARQPRRVARDALVAFIFAALVLFGTLGTDPESYFWFWKTLSTDSYAPISWAQRGAHAWRDLTTPGGALWPALEIPIQLLSNDKKFSIALRILVGACLFWGALQEIRRAPLLGLALLLVLPAIYATGFTWVATYVLLFPFLILAAGGFLRTSSKWGSLFALLWLAGSCAFLTTGLPDGRSELTEISEHYAYRFGKDLQISYGELLKGRKWAALLTNGVPPVLAPGVSFPINRAFTATCMIFPPWSEEQIRAGIEKGGLRIATEQSLGRAGCRPARLIEFARSRCHNVFSMLRGTPAAVDFLDCP